MTCPIKVKRYCVKPYERKGSPVKGYCVSEHDRKCKGTPSVLVHQKKVSKYDRELKLVRESRSPSID